MSLVSDAGSVRSSAFSAARSWLLERSASSHDRPLTPGGCGAAATAESEARTMAKKSSAQRMLLARDDERLEAELGLDALRNRARGFIGAVGTDVQPPEVSAGEHLDGVGQPRKLPRDAA